MPEKDLTIRLRMDRSQQQRESREFASTEKRLIGEVAAEDRRLRDERGRFVRRDAAERIGAERAVAAEVRKTGQASGMAAEFAGKLGSSLRSLAGGAASIGLVTQAASAFVNILKEANAEADRQVDRLMKTKDMIREIVMITGGAGGPSDAEVRKFMAVRTASGLSAAEAQQNILEFEGAGAASKGLNISEAEYERLKPMQARFAATAGGGAGAAGTFGKLSGLLLGLRKYDTAEEVVASEAQFNRILSRGVGDNPTLIKQAAQVAGAFVAEGGKGIVKDERELAAITATASKINPEQSAEILKSSMRVIRGFDEKWKELLEEVNIKESDTYVEASGKLYAHLESVEQSGRSVDAYMAERGVPQAAALHTMSMYRYRGMTAATMEAEAERMTGDEAKAQVEQKYREDVTLRTKVAEAKKEEAELGVAMPRQFAEELKLEAEKNLILRGEGPESAAAKGEDYWAGIRAAPHLPMVDHEALGRRMRTEREMHRLASERGLDVPGRPEDTSMLGGTPFGYTNWLLAGGDLDAYSAVGTEMELHGRLGGPAAGKKPGVYAGEAGNPALERLDAIKQAIERGNQQRADDRTRNAPPIQARPAVQTR